MYESFFGLSGKPFQLNPDPSFFFASRGHKRALAYLEYGLHQNEGFIVITGEVGAGKTTLVKSLLQRLDPDKVVAAQLVSTHLDAEDMLRMVSAAFGIPSKPMDKAEVLLGLEMFLVSLTAVGKRALLIVDEAQNLTPRAVEELRMLSNFQLGEHALLQSFLVGQPELRVLMQSAHMRQLRQRVIASYHLGPMDGDETTAYIEHRLAHVGWQGNPSLDESAYRAIFEFTGGIPRRINTFCDRLLLAAYLGGKTTLSLGEVDDVVAEIRDENETTAARDSSFPTNGSFQSISSETGVPAIALTPDFDPSRLKCDSTVAEKVYGLAADFDTVRFEQRLLTLERAVSETLALLRQLVDQTRSRASEDSRLQ